MRTNSESTNWISAVVGEAAQQRHGGMLVAVDQSRHDYALVAWQRYSRRVARFDVARRTHVDDHALVDRHGAVFYHRELLVHRHDVFAGHDQVDGVVRCLGRRFRGRARGQQQDGERQKSDSGHIGSK
jgi:hypothetical protein